MIDFKQIEKLDIKWPVKYDPDYNSIFDSAGKFTLMLTIKESISEEQHKDIGEFVAATLNALHNDPKRFGELIESK